MHVLTLEEAINLGPTIGSLDAGKWLCQDINAFEFAARANRGKAYVNLFCTPLPIYAQSGLKTKTLFVRSGAWGDLLLLLPALKAYKAANPNQDIALSCFAFRHPMFDGNTWLDEILPYPLKIETAESFDRIISLENVMENNHGLHATDAFAEAIGVKVEDYKPDYLLKPSELVSAQQHIGKDRPIVGVQMRASVHNRDYPAQNWAEVILGLEERGWEVLLFGVPGQIPPLPPGIREKRVINLAEKNLTFRESAAVLAQCTAFVGVDSSLIHLCHALDIPAIGLYGPFSWKTRTSKAPLTKAISGVGDCAPCNWHSHAGRHFPPNKPCSKAQQCVVLQSIQPSRIISQVDQLKP